MCLPLIYLAFHFGLPPYWLLAVLIAIDFVSIWIRIGFSSHYCNISVAYYAVKVLLPVAGVTVVSTLLVLPMINVVDSQLVCFLLSSAVWCVICPLAVYFIGLDSGERRSLRKTVAKYFKFSKHEVESPDNS